MTTNGFLARVLFACLSIRLGATFSPSRFQPATRVRLFSSTGTQPEVLDVELEKPLGMILEEVEQG
eukprot:CAMPEP_0117065896 /NCGR_PEP_ID=MMETSP0472-20121206/46091_1 /TAXON_ID=693140 ORGANISM="Tiarina fusus, Strain LIS" /NCGR_SAMPLE_ID=MMETSP0472 /ASSEMBLY_ACC=CAM_ASM_000603 /LENGTH=65 /DNA_ID=CAMNT_0004786753 /DNA_START=6 /DNA_END=199 /DNA_ORIENTATION=-